MKPAPFAYFAPHTVDEVMELLRQYGDDAKVLAGGQSFIPTMSFRLAQPEVIIDLNGVEGLADLRQVEGGLRIGAMCRQRTVERSPVVARRAPLLAEAIPYIAHPQIRNRGTFGGSLAHADPASELPAVLSVLEGRFRIRRQHGEEWVVVDDFFIALFQTAVGPADLLLEVEIPDLAVGSGWAFQEFSRRQGDYALVGVAVVLEMAGSICRRARIALLSVGEGPVRARLGEAALQGQPMDAALLRRVADIVAQQDIDPPADIHASKDFRRHLAAVLTRRTLSRAVARASDTAGEAAP